ncbi:ribosome recycling factor [Acidithiobacillus sp.]
MSIQAVKKEAETRMKKSIESLKGELTRLRTGRASAGLLDHVMVDYYHTPTPLAQVASVSVADARALLVTPWEKNMIPKIDKAIRDAGLGLNPVAGSDSVRIPLPPLSEERRKEMVKVVRQEGEGARVAIRNIRRDSIAQVKELQKQKAISEDEERRAEEEIQRLTDRYIDEVDAVVEAKEADLMEV